MSELELFDIDQLRNLTGIKWSRDGEEVLPAWVADMDIRPARVITDALSSVIETGDFGYNRRTGELLPQAFVDWQTKQHGWSPDVSQVRPFCDVLHAIDVALWLHTEPGDGIVLLTPIYPPFLKAVNGSGRRLVDVPLDPQGWRLDPDRLQAAVDDRTKAILICNPHNPTGRVFDRAELEAIGRVAVEHDLLLLSDEVWADLLHPGAGHTPMASIDDEIAAQTVTISSASKAFNLAGLRCAVAHIGHPGVATALEGLPAHLLGAVSIPGAIAAITAWTEGETWLGELRHHLTARRDQLASRLSAELPAMGFQSPEATYLAWLDCRAWELGDDPAIEVLAKAGVALSSGPDFGPLGHGFTRLNFATSEPILDSVIDRLTRFLAA